MAKRPPIGKCVHCLADNVERTWDHVFPSSWYPDTTPQNLEKWKVPSCFPCNNALGSLERDMLLRFSAALDHDKPGYKNLWKQALRQIEPQYAKDEKDRRARTSAQEKFAAELRFGDSIPEEGIIPGLHERWKRPRQEQIAVLLRAEHLQRLTEKIVRGVAYLYGGQFIEQPYQINGEVFEQGSNIHEHLMRHGTQFMRGDIIAVIRAAVVPTTTTVYGIQFWSQFWTYASVGELPRD